MFSSSCVDSPRSCCRPDGTGASKFRFRRGASSDADPLSRSGARTLKPPFTYECCVALLCGAIAAAGAAAQDDPGRAAETAAAPETAQTPGQSETSRPFGLSGRLDLKYVGRWTDGAHDNDLFGYLSLDAGDARQHAVTGHLSGRLALDLDRNRDPTHPFFTVDDTYDSDLHGVLYGAHVDFNRVADGPLPDFLSRVRVGRQVLNDTPETVFLDGASVRTAPLVGAVDLTLEAWVGVPSHLFESSPSGDFTTGAAATMTPWTGADLRFDYMHLVDDYLGSTDHDDLFGLRLAQRLGEPLYARAHINMLEGKARDLGAHLSWTEIDHDLVVTARYLALFSDQTRHAIDLDYFTELQQTYFAYHQWELHADKGLGDHLFVAGGVQLRELDDDSDESIFNHEFRRYWLSPGVDDWPWTGLSASLTAEHWDSGGDRFSSFGGELSQGLAERWDASLGTFFQLYRYDVLLDQEREDVQVSYAKLDFEATDSVRLRARFEFEDGDVEDFATLTLGARMDF